MIKINCKIKKHGTTLPNSIITFSKKTPTATLKHQNKSKIGYKA